MQGFMDGVIWTDNEVGTCPNEDAATNIEHRRDRSPVILFQKSAVFTETERMEDDFRMMMPTKEFRAFSCNGLVAERCSRSTAGRNPYGL